MDSKNDTFNRIVIPPSLRTVQPFLDDAQKFLRYATNGKQGPGSDKFYKISMSCINHAFKLNCLLNMEMGPEDRSCLESFVDLRLECLRGLGINPHEAELQKYEDPQIEDIGTHELLISEADTVLALADEQLEEGMKFDAMLNFHTACVFFRVMETMIPSKASANQHSKLVYAAQRTRQASSLYQNFVRENFTSGSCADTYDVHGSSKLGKGSYGSVYLATHRVTGDERAVKVMNVDRITSYYLRKLHTEISILKSLDHPNIIKLQDVFFGRRSVYIITDLCRGGELFELLNSGKNQGFVFREDRASKLMRDMLSAVHYLHENGIVHRDLKLENFLFEDHSSNSPLILIDFGLSKHFTKGERLTQKVGSCYYTAPEVLNGNYDYRCDIWSLGVLCYMLLSGSPPFYGKSVEDVYQSILTKEASFTDKKFRHVSNGCLDFMKRLLVRDVRNRMSTADALNHPFITGAAFMPMYRSFRSSDKDTSKKDDNAGLGLDKASQAIDSMLVFAYADPMTKITMEMVSHTLGSTELQQFRDEFRQIDRSHLGSISKEDFVNTFGACDLIRTGAVDIHSLYDGVGLSRSLGTGKDITYHEYVASVMHNRLSVEDKRLKLIFSFLDTDAAGKISVDSIRNALGEDLPAPLLQQMIRVADKDEDNFVTESDLMMLWKSVWASKDAGRK